MPHRRIVLPRRMPALLAGWALVLGGLLALAPGVAAAAAAGPALSVPDADLEAAVSCGADVRDATRAPVVLVHGTTSTPEETWGAGYLPILAARGIPACTVRLPNRAMSDAQLSSEYVVFAVRRAAALSGRQVSLVGHSQGTLQVAWALAFWPDVAAATDDAVLLSGDYNGTTLADASCGGGSCAPSIWQQRPQSAFLRALRARPLAAGVDYTTISSATDEVVVPAPGAGNVPGATNVVVQERCPGRPVDHFSMVVDSAGVDLALDALEHPGPTVLSRVPQSTCVAATHPQADAARVAQAGPVALTNFAIQSAAFPQVDREPALRCYVTGACAGGARPPAVASSRLYAKRVRGSERCVRGRRCAPVSASLGLRGARAVPGRVLYLRRRADGSFADVGHRSLTLPAAGVRRAIALSRTVTRDGRRVRLADHDYRLLLESREGGGWNVERAFTLRVGLVR